MIKEKPAFALPGWPALFALIIVSVAATAGFVALGVLNPTFIVDQWVFFTVMVIAYLLHWVLYAGFTAVAPNIIVKFPATKVGIAVMEEATYRGVSINCTVSFSVAQAVAAAEAVERGLKRREAEGLPTDDMGPVITIMVGRVDDWLKVLVERDGIVVHPAALAYSGVAVFKRAYGIFQERGFRARLLAAAIRHHLHWSEFVGGDVIITMPSSWQKKFNASAIEVHERMHESVDPIYINELLAAFPDFRRAFQPDGLTTDEFDSFPPSVRTLRAFIASYHDLLAAVTDAQLPNPDLRS